MERQPKIYSSTVRMTDDQWRVLTEKKPHRTVTDGIRYNTIQIDFFRPIRWRTWSEMGL